MITVVAGTNKKGSLTRQVAENYFNRIQAHGKDVRLLLLEEIDFSFITHGMFFHRPAEAIKLQKDFFDPATTLVFVVPEYNGSFPGILKVLIDSFDVKAAFENKRAALVGVATGRGGNLRGLDHLTGILHHMHVTIITGNVLISKAKEELDAKGDFIHDVTSKLVDKHVVKIITE
jgi:NAD(P)H-dependent FMN reductase